MKLSRNQNQQNTSLLLIGMKYKYTTLVVLKSMELLRLYQKGKKMQIHVYIILD